MNRTLKITVFIIIFFGLIFLGILGLSRLKVDDFKKAAVIILVDSSASNQNSLQKEKLAVRQLCGMLDPEDQIKILRVSEDSYLIYEGSPQAFSEIRESMEMFTKYNSKEYGTAYGLAMKKAFEHALNMKKIGYIPAVVVVGDLENEGSSSKQLDWDQIPKDVAAIKSKAPDFSMMFLFALPEKLDLVKEKLGPILGEKNLIIAPETTTNRALRKFLVSIGR